MYTVNSLLVMRVAINTFTFCFFLCNGQSSGLVHCIFTGSISTALSLKHWSIRTFGVIAEARGAGSWQRVSFLFNFF